MDMDLKAKINYFLKKAPPKSAEKLSEILNEVNIFSKDVLSSHR